MTKYIKNNVYDIRIIKLIALYIFIVNIFRSTNVDTIYLKTSQNLDGRSIH